MKVKILTSVLVMKIVNTEEKHSANYCGIFDTDIQRMYCTEILKDKPARCELILMEEFVAKISVLKGIDVV